MTDELIQEVLNNVDSKEGVLNLIVQMIEDEKNDWNLGEKMRNTFKNYFSEPQ